MPRKLNHIEENVVRDQLTRLRQVQYTFKKLKLDTEQFNELVENLYDEMISVIADTDIAKTEG